MEKEIFNWVKRFFCVVDKMGMERCERWILNFMNDELFLEYWESLKIKRFLRQISFQDSLLSKLVLVSKKTSTQKFSMFNETLTFQLTLMYLQFHFQVYNWTFQTSPHHTYIIFILFNVQMQVWSQQQLNYPTDVFILFVIP